MSLQQLIRETFIADFCTFNHQLRIRRGSLFRNNLRESTISTFGWSLFGIKCLPITKKGRRYYGILGMGYVVSKDLCKIFSDAGVADCFVFTTEAEKVKRNHSNVYDHYFVPHSATFNIRVGVKEGSSQVDWQQLNKDVANHTLMAVLKKDI